MATKTLTASYLSKLTNANHDGVTRQIYDRLKEAEVSNTTFDELVKAVGEARQKEDDAYRRYSARDFVSDDLRLADELEDKYMSGIHNILRGILYLPESEPIHRQAMMADQLFRDFNFATADGYEAEASKTVNMVQQWKASKDYSLEELGISKWVDKANAQAERVLALIAQRVENESMKVKGEMVDARKATDEAIRKAYEMVSALNVVQPTTALTTLTSLLFAIEDRARMYYLPGGKTGGGNPVPNPGGGEEPDAPGSEMPPLGGD